MFTIELLGGRCIKDGACPALGRLAGNGVGYGHGRTHGIRLVGLGIQRSIRDA